MVTDKMMSFLFPNASGEEPQIKTVELEGAREIKPVEDLGEAGEFFANIWEQQCLFHAVLAFVELRIPDVIGIDSFTVKELASRCLVENTRALEALCAVLCKHDVLTRDGDRISLGKHGALLQRNYSTKYVDMLSYMSADNTTKIWGNLSTVIADVGESLGGDVDDTILNLYCPDWNGVAADEVTEAVAAFDIETTGALKIGVWSLENAVEYTQRLFPNANVYRIDGSEQFEVDTDLFIFHKIFTLFGIPDTVKAAADKLKTGGRTVLIDVVAHPKLSTDNLFMHAARVPDFMSETEWTTLLSEAFELTSMKSVREGVVAILLEKPHRV